MFKLFKRIGDRQIAKYYATETLAGKRKTDKWELQKSDKVDCTAQSVNKGNLVAPKYEIELVNEGIRFGCPTEGLANQLVELLSANYAHVKAYLVESESEESLPWVQGDGDI